MRFRLLVLVVLVATAGCKRAEYAGPCSTDADCDDQNGCTSDFCTTGECHHTSFPDGLQCNDGDPCTSEDVCASGQCQGTAKDCSTYDGPCTQGACESATGECGPVPKPDGTGCDDGQYCTENDACRAGECTGAALDCGDADDCTLDECNEADEQCDHINQPQPGAEKSSLGDTCSNGVDDDCDGLTDANDPNCGTCTTDAECDDGLECTQDACSNQECQNDPIDDGTDCDDTRYCTVSDKCTGGVCAGTPRDCSAQGDACNDGICSEAGKTCEGQEVSNGTQCDDGFYCTLGDSCQEGQCTGSPNSCDDNNPCTSDDCLEDSDRCEHTLQPFPGAEGPTGTPTCSNGVDDDCDGLTDRDDGNCFDCQADLDCEDNNICTSDRCVSGECQNNAITDGTSCDDGHYCTDPDSCTGGVCFGTTRDCRDSDMCTEDVCDETNDECTHTWQELPEETDICWDTVDQDCDGVTDGCCLGTGALLPGTGYAAGNRPHSVAVGDFNADGILDLAVTDAGLNELNILLGAGSGGRGDGTFADKVVYSADDTPRGIAAGDFNADGILDLVVVAGGVDELNVFTGDGSGGQGDGTFTRGVDLQTNDSPMQIMVGYFNGDGILDLAATSPSEGKVNVFIGNASGTSGKGDGTFAAKVEYTTGVGTWGIAGGDFNADGTTDLVVTNTNTATAGILLGNGDSTFADPVTYSTGATPHSVAVGDFNADGILDLAVANNGATNVSVLLGLGNDGKGNGTFDTKEDYPTDSMPTDVITRDFNQDGILDLAVVNQDANSVSIRLGNGSGGRGDGSFAGEADDPSDESPRAVASGDFDADGIPDLVVTNNGAGNLSVFLGAGSGARAQGGFSGAGGSATGERPNYVLAADFNRDGILDLATANLGDDPNIGDVRVFMGQGVDGRGDGTFTQTAALEQGNTPGSLAVGDFDADAIPDLAVANRVSDTVSVFLGRGTDGRGDGTFAYQADHPAGQGLFGIAAADLNGDRILDLVVASNFENKVSVMLGAGTGGRGNGSFSTAVVYDTGIGPYTPVVADFNRDGIPDLAVANSDADTVSILLGNGNGIFADKVDYTTDNDPRWIAVGDVDSDGFLDLAVGNFNGGSVSVLSGAGDGTFGTKRDTQVGGRIGWVALADVNGDAILDLLTANYDGGDLSVLLGNGSNGQGEGTFASKTDIPAGDTPTAFAVGDFNADGVPDLAVTSKFDYRVDILRGERQCLTP